MRVKCVVSHKVDGEPGKFDRYEAGQEYDVEKLNQYFEAVDEPRKAVNRTVGTVKKKVRR